MEQPQVNQNARALVSIAIFESVLLGLVVAVYLYTNNLTYLIGGVIGSQIVCAPMFIRWAKAQADAQKAQAEKQR